MNLKQLAKNGQNNEYSQGHISSRVCVYIIVTWKSALDEFLAYSRKACACKIYIQIYRPLLGCPGRTGKN